MLVLMIFPPSVARDLGTTVIMLPLVVLTYVVPAGVVAIRAPMDGVTVGRVYVAWVPAHKGHTLDMYTFYKAFQKVSKRKIQIVDVMCMFTLALGLI